MLKRGDLVEFKGKDSYYKGYIVSIFKKYQSKELRCVVQDDRGLLLIKNPKDAIVIESTENINSQTEEAMLLSLQEFILNNDPPCQFEDCKDFIKDKFKTEEYYTRGLLLQYINSGQLVLTSNIKIDIKNRNKK